MQHEHELYGLREIAEALGTDPAKVRVWKQRGHLPKPDAELAMGPVWFAATIEPWIKKRVELMFGSGGRTTIDNLGGGT